MMKTKDNSKEMSQWKLSTVMCPVQCRSQKGEGRYRGEHHEIATVGVLVLKGALPVLFDPLCLDQQPEILVGEGGGRASPGASVSATVYVATAEGVRTEECDNLLVVEAHAVENLSASTAHEYERHVRAYSHRWKVMQLHPAPTASTKVVARRTCACRNPYLVPWIVAGLVPWSALGRRPSGGHHSPEGASERPALNPILGPPISSIATIEARIQMSAMLA